MPDDWPTVSADRDDDIFLFAAEAENAEYIVTYDQSHLLRIKEFKGIPIGTPDNTILGHLFTLLSLHMPGSFSSESWLNQYRNGGSGEPKYPD